LNTKITLQHDVKAVDTILKEAKVVKETNLNQIRLFLNGNPNSHLYLKFADQYPSLLGKYPKVTMQAIEEAMQMVPSIIPSKYQHFMNIENASIFTVKDLEALADWDTLPTSLKTTKVYRAEVIDGRVVNFNSQPEWKTYLALKEKGYIQSFRAQSLLIPYASYLKRDKQYYPDFIFLTPEGYIAIVESKPTSIMNTFLVRCKYEGLKHFCASRGFIYAMMDEHLTTLEMIKANPIVNSITQYVDQLIADVGVFNDEALKLVYHQFSEYTQQDIKTMLGHYVLQNDYVNKSKVGFNIKKRRKFDAIRLAQRNAHHG
jgi:hypothetical protein